MNEMINLSFNKAKERISDMIQKGEESGNCHDAVENHAEGIRFLEYLQAFINKRKKEMPKDSYTTKLFESGINKIAQKVGEEAVELVIEAKDQNDELFLNEAADLIYHFIVLLSARGYSFNDVAKVLSARHLS